MTSHPTSQNGNVLFLILIAVALFAALSYAVTSSSRNGSNSSSSENASMYASSVLQYGTLIDATLQRMRLSTNKQVWQFDYSDLGKTVDANDNTNCTDNNCRLYKVKGGQIANVNLGIKPLAPGFIAAYPALKKPYIAFRSIVVQNVGTASPELVLIIDGLDFKICNAINLKLNGFSDTPEQSYGTGGEYTGLLTDFPAASGYAIGSNASNLVGKLAGCLKDNSGTPWGTYYQVLLAR